MSVSELRGSSPTDPLKDMAAKWKMRVSHGAIQAQQTDRELVARSAVKMSPADPARQMMLKWKMKGRSSDVSSRESMGIEEQFTTSGKRWISVLAGVLDGCDRLMETLRGLFDDFSRAAAMPHDHWQVPAPNTSAPLGARYNVNEWTAYL